MKSSKPVPFFLTFFHNQVCSGLSTQFEQAFVALNLPEGHDLKIFKEQPPVVAPSNPNRILDPEHLVVPFSGDNFR